MSELIYGGDICSGMNISQVPATLPHQVGPLGPGRSLRHLPKVGTFHGCCHSNLQWGSESIMVKLWMFAADYETFCGSCPKTANAGAGYMRTLFHSLEGQSSCQKHLDKIRNRTPSLDIGIVCTSLFVVF